jgi:hypothetical protein
VLREIHLVRALLQRLLGRGCLEVDLGHLPVALVLVREVVEGVEEPVLNRELVPMGRVRGHVRVDGRLGAGAPALEVLLIDAAGFERVARLVDVVALAKPEQVGPGRRLLHHLAVRTAQHHPLAAELDVHAGWAVRLAVAAWSGLRLEGEDRRVAVRQLLVGRLRGVPHTRGEGE